MLAWYHINQKPITAVMTYSAVPVGVTEDGTAALLFAVDHVYWTDTIADAARNHAKQASGSQNRVSEIWLLGFASDRTRQELTDLGYSVYEDVASMIVVASD